MERLDNSKLSPIQKHIVNMISKEKRIAIVGGPGTGKTVLAMSGMNKSGERKQILLTYSKPLSKMIEGCSIDATTVHSFCWSLGSKMEQELNQFYYEHRKRYKSRIFNDIITREYGYQKTGWPQWDNLLKTYSKLSTYAKNQIRYDDIFIDEGQDLPDEAFEFFSKIADRIIVTYDDAQEVGKESETGNNDQIFRKAGIDCNRIIQTLGLQESFYDLIDNFRNAGAIERVAKLFYNNYGNNAYSLRPTISKRKMGSLPKAIYCDYDQEMINNIADNAYQLNKQVGIIVPDRESFYRLKDMMDEAIEEEFISEDKFFYKYAYTDNMKNADDLNQTGVFLMTYKSSKGMEFDEVYLFDCEKISLETPQEKNKFYVAVTRAKDELTFIFRCESDYKCDVSNVIEEHKDFFEIKELL